jgi:hypothetical protein
MPDISLPNSTPSISLLRIKSRACNIEDNLPDSVNLRISSTRLPGGCWRVCAAACEYGKTNTCNTEKKSILNKKCLILTPTYKYRQYCYLSENESRQDKLTSYTKNYPDDNINNNENYRELQK